MLQWSQASAIFYPRQADRHKAPVILLAVFGRFIAPQPRRVEGDLIRKMVPAQRERPVHRLLHIRGVGLFQAAG
jgi:hypothetical protein